MRILVADDSATSREGAVAALRAAGHEVHEAASGVQAWALSARHRFDLAFVSLQLPQLDGLELCSLWRRNADSIGALPVVLLAEPAQAAALRNWSALTGLDRSPEVLTRPFAASLLPDVASAASGMGLGAVEAGTG